MEKRETAGHVLKDGALEAVWDVGLGRWRGLGVQNVVETRHQLLHDQCGHPRTGQETHAQKLDDVRVAEGAHQLALPHELARRLLDALTRHLSRVQEEVVDFLCGAHCSRNSYLLYAAIRASPNCRARGSGVGEKERAEVGMISEKSPSCHFCRRLCLDKGRGSYTFSECNVSRARECRKQVENYT